MFRKALMTFAAAVGCAACAGATEMAGNGQVQLAYWVHGDERGIPLVILNGQGAATRPDGDGLSNALVAAGFKVILIDNRDSGQSSVLTKAGAPPDWAEIGASLADGTPPAVAYELSDMADDTIAVLDAARIERAHVLGHSLGGMIAQVLAAEHPDRVASLISVSATSGDPDLPFGPAMAAMMEMEPLQSETPAEQLARAYRIFEGSAARRMSAAEVSARVAADMAVDDPNAAARQGAAAGASGDRRGLLGQIKAPSLVIHGRDDPWFPTIHADSTAAALGHARIEIVDGMGHIISDDAGPLVAQRVADFVRGLSPQ